MSYIAPNTLLDYTPADIQIKWLIWWIRTGAQHGIRRQLYQH